MRLAPPNALSTPTPRCINIYSLPSVPRSMWSAAELQRRF